jgi:hypothetical protein
MTTEPGIQLLDHLVGSWTTEMTHPALPGVVVQGTALFEWLEGEQFLIHRGRTDHPDFPDSISIVGITDRDRVDDAAGDQAAVIESPMRMHYFDSRGVFRVYDIAIDDQAWRIWRDSPGFSQRFTGAFADNGDTISGVWQLRRDVQWDDDLEITYRRQS